MIKFAGYIKGAYTQGSEIVFTVHSSSFATFDLLRDSFEGEREADHEDACIWFDFTAERA